eukprot:SAG31_NODE_8214_length_1495_cov_2.056590_2_plen_92_part_00
MLVAPVFQTLIVCSFVGHVPVLKLLIAAKADIEAVAADQKVGGLRPLHMAAMSGQLGAVQVRYLTEQPIEATRPSFASKASPRDDGFEFRP